MEFPDRYSLVRWRRASTIGSDIRKRARTISKWSASRQTFHPDRSKMLSQTEPAAVSWPKEYLLISKRTAVNVYRCLRAPPPSHPEDRYFMLRPLSTAYMLLPLASEVTCAPGNVNETIRHLSRDYTKECFTIIIISIVSIIMTVSLQNIQKPFENVLLLFEVDIVHNSTISLHHRHRRATPRSTTPPR